MRIANDQSEQVPADVEAPRSTVDFDSQFAAARADLRAFIDRRISPSLRRRVDPSDVIQDTHLLAARRYETFARQGTMPFRIWILKTAQQQLIHCYRAHVGAAKRTVRREIEWSDVSSTCLAQTFRGANASPSTELEAAESHGQILAAIELLAEVDREILVMRHVENRPYDEIATLLDLQSATVRQRCGRALLRLRTVMGDRGLLDR